MRHARWTVVAMTVGLLAISGGDAFAKKGGGGKPGGGGDDPGNTTPPDIVVLSDNEELHLLQDDGTGETYLATAPGARAAWSPDGTQVAYWGESDGYGIYIADVAGGTPEKVISIDDPTTRQVAWSPVPAPDGEYKLAFMMKRTEEDGTPSQYHDIFIANLDGTGLENVSRSSGSDWNPSWSPDAGQLSFTYGSSIWIVDIEHRAADGKPTWHEVYQSSTLRPNHAEWARTGDAIAFAAYDWTQTDPLMDIYRINVSYSSAAGAWTGSAPVNITNSPDDEERMPSWSPDDSMIVCANAHWKPSRKGRATVGLTVVTVSNGARQTLVSGGDYDYPVWKRSVP